jgi:hypothetical protein
MIAAGIFALLINLLFDGDFRWFLLYYFVPVGIPFVAFLLDRAEQYTRASIASWALDFVVLIPALARAFVRIPFISGHALFLSYCLLTSRSIVARVTAALVLLQVVYIKIFITHDTALFGGILAGCIAALIYRRIQPNWKQLPVATPCASEQTE